MNDEESIARLNVENGREGRVPRKYKLMLLIAADNFFPMRVIYYFFIAFLFGICSQPGSIFIFHFLTTNTLRYKWAGMTPVTASLLPRSSADLNINQIFLICFGLSPLLPK